MCVHDLCPDTLSCLLDRLVLADLARASRVRRAWRDAAGHKRQEWDRASVPIEVPRRPQFVTQLPGGDALLTHRWSHRLHVYTASGIRPRVLGSFGDGSLQFDTPRGVACAAARLYVVDSGNDRLQAFSVGADDCGAEPAALPISHMVRGSALTLHQKATKFGLLESAELQKLRYVCDHPFMRAQRLAVDGSTLYVLCEHAYATNTTALIYLVELATLEHGAAFPARYECFMLPSATRASGLTAHRERVYIADRGADQVRIFAPDAIAGAPRRLGWGQALSFGRTGDLPGEFRSPTHVSVTCPLHDYCMSVTWPLHARYMAQASSALRQTCVSSTMLLCASSKAAVSSC